MEEWPINGNTHTHTHGSGRVLKTLRTYAGLYMDSGQELSARRLKLTASDRNSMGPGEQRHCANDIICILAWAPQNTLSLSEVTLSSPSNQYRQPGQWREWIWRTMHQKKERERERNALTFFHSLCDLFQMRGYEKKRQVRMDGWLERMNKWKAGLFFVATRDSRNNPILKTKDTV